MLYLSKESMPHEEKRSRPIEQWRNSCILWKTNLPLRGPRDDRSSTSSNRDDRTSTSSNRDDRTSTSSNRGNFWAILEMMAKRDDTLREHLETGRKNAQYTSRIIHNEVIDEVAEYVRKENTRSLENENAFFSIMAD